MPIERRATVGGKGTEQEQLQCPRCDSSNTKFCYYNNYNFSQPRHFCKSCRRYWTQGGALRDIPIGGATRKTTTAKRPRGRGTFTSLLNASPAPSTFLPLARLGPAFGWPFPDLGYMPSWHLDTAGGFSSLN